MRAVVSGAEQQLSEENDARIVESLSEAKRCVYFVLLCAVLNRYTMCVRASAHFKISELCLYTVSGAE